MGKMYIIETDYVEERQKHKRRICSMFKRRLDYLSHGADACNPPRQPLVFTAKIRGRTAGGRSTSKARPQTAPPAPTARSYIARPCRPAPVWKDSFVLSRCSSALTQLESRQSTPLPPVQLIPEEEVTSPRQRPWSTGGLLRRSIVKHGECGSKAPTNSPSERPAERQDAATGFLLAMKMLQLEQQGPRQLRDSLVSLQGTEPVQAQDERSLEHRLAQYGGHYNRPDPTSHHGTPEQCVRIGSAQLHVRPEAGTTSAPELKLCVTDQLKRSRVSADYTCNATNVALLHRHQVM